MSRHIQKSGNSSVWGSIYADNRSYDPAPEEDTPYSPVSLAHRHESNDVHWCVYAAIAGLAMLISIVLSSGWFNSIVQ